MKRRKQQDLLFKSLGQSQQEEKQLQAKLKAINEKLAMIGSVRAVLGVHCSWTVVDATVLAFQ